MPQYFSQDLVPQNFLPLLFISSAFFFSKVLMIEIRNSKHYEENFLRKFSFEKKKKLSSLALVNSRINLLP